MSLPHIILTVLSTQEATGYGITKEFTRSLGSFWKAQHQQVYRELSKMAGKKLVTCRLEPQEGKPDRKIYTITELGRAALFNWFKEPIQGPNGSDPILAKLLVCGEHNSEPMQQQLEALIVESHIQIENSLLFESSHFSNYKELDRKARLERLALRRQIHTINAQIRWAHEVLSELKTIDSPKSYYAIAS